MMITRIAKLHRVAAMLVAFAASGAPSPAAAANLDGSRPLLCAVNTIMECDGSGQCLRLASDKHPDFPSFLRVDVGERTITDGSGAPQPRMTAIKTVTRLDGRLILHGGENGRGWAATIAESSGRMSAGVVADEFAFALFGACTTP
jgi:hypothetical protein